jgi:AraC-like DNA-binding protein
MEKALELLNETDMTVTEIAAACGYSLPTTFMRAFKKTYGVVPSSVKRSISE